MKRVLVASSTWAAALLLPTAIIAQVPGASSDTVERAVHGRVMDGSSARDRPLANQLVVLHRIASNGAGPVDSIRTARDGSYRIRYRPRGEAMYIVAVRYAGVAYFSAPITSDIVGDEHDAEVVVYDTTSRAHPVTLRGRHLIVSAPDAQGVRAVVEVFELSNDSTVTVVSTTDRPPVWDAAIPGAALRPRVGDGEFAADAVRFPSSRVQLFAPLPPGLKQLVISYELPPSAFPLHLTVDRPTTILEVLLEEQQGQVSGAGLKAQAPVTVSGRRFVRALAQDVAASAALAIVVPATPGTDPSSRWLAIPMALIGALGAWWFVRRRHGAARVMIERRGAEALAEQVATVDAMLARSEGLDDATRRGLRAERDRLMTHLRRVLAEGRSTR